MLPTIITATATPITNGAAAALAAAWCDRAAQQFNNLLGSHTAAPPMDASTIGTLSGNVYQPFYISNCLPWATGYLQICDFLTSLEECFDRLPSTDEWRCLYKPHI